MKSFQVVAVALTLTAFPMSALAQTREPSAAASRLRGGPIEVLLQHRDQLGLTVEQVSRLETVQSGYGSGISR
jgi:hypothetical protein